MGDQAGGWQRKLRLWPSTWVVLAARYTIIGKEKLIEKMFPGGEAVREYIVSESGERTRVLLDIAEYERLVEAAEELEDIAAYDEAKAAIENGEDRPTPLREALPRIEREREELRRKGIV